MWILWRRHLISLNNKFSWHLNILVKVLNRERKHLTSLTLFPHVGVYLRHGFCSQILKMLMGIGLFLSNSWNIPLTVNPVGWDMFDTHFYISVFLSNRVKSVKMIYLVIFIVTKKSKEGMSHNLSATKIVEILDMSETSQILMFLKEITRYLPFQTCNLIGYFGSIQKN